ncbi:hypothetical protein Acr_04g0004760 [Actinidia rufa]|uniref:Uncharacterized protein n=1 Tax=Actinidia rufa TaxID=165716 RepID=A0A7J0EGX4_9ERIC|nr:hypothetical protein Acr_04g0004760 [Actinidia rufa]
MNRGRKSVKERSPKLGTPNKKRSRTEITLNDQFGLLDVGDVHVKEDVNGLEVIPTMSRNHEIPISEPPALSPNLPEPLELHVPTLEPSIIPMTN